MLSNLDLHKARLKALGGSAEERMQREKLKSLEAALKYSYQSERIFKDGVEYRALLNNNKLKPDYDDKIISIPHSAQFKVGDIFFWERTSSNWIVYLRQYTEDAYFRGYVRRAEHKVRWKDEFGNLIEVYAAVRGPVEDKIRSQAKGGLSFDEPNYSLSLIIPSNENTKKLKRYSRVTVADQPWEVAAVDSISEEGVIELALVENYLNREEDTKELVGGKIKTKIKVSSCLDELHEVKVGIPVPLWTEVLIDDKISNNLTKGIRYSVIEGNAQIANNSLTLLTEGLIKVRLNIEDINFTKDFDIQGLEVTTQNIVDFDITGNERVKSFGASTFKIVKYENGQIVEANGQWQFDNNPNLFKVLSEDKNAITFEWVNGVYGELKLSYQEEDRIETKTIKIEGLL